MSIYQEKNFRAYQKAKTQFEEIEQASELDMEEMLELSDWGFRTNMINILRVLIDKVDSMHEQMDNKSRDMKILGKK